MFRMSPYPLPYIRGHFVKSRLLCYFAGMIDTFQRPRQIRRRGRVDGR